MNRHVRNFLFILAAALGSALLGGAFATGIALLSPEFARECFFTEADGIVRYAAAVGLVAGLFIGAGAMAFCLFVAAIANWFRPKQKTDEC